MRPHLQHLVTEQLRTVREQILEFQLLEQQLAQVLERLRTAPPSNHANGCRCLETEAPMAQGTVPQPPPPTREGADMRGSHTLESLTLLPTTMKGSCGCGCDDDFVSGAVIVPLAPAIERDVRAADASHKQEESV
jgi:hypothetical protein